jgi:sulfur carrier protein
MRIVLNGEDKSLDGSPTVSQLLAQLGLAERRVAVEINREILPRSRHAEYRLQERDQVEVVLAIGGG